MKDKFKKLLLALLMSLAMLSLFGCASESTVEPMTAETEQSLAESAQLMFYQIISMSDDEVNDLIEAFSEEQDTIMINGLNAWLSSEEDLGAFVRIKSTEVEQDSSSGEYSISIVAEFEQRDCEFAVGLNKRMTQYTNLAFSPVYTASELMMEGLGNLVVGMSAVFIVLISLAWVISLFKYIYIFEEKAQQKHKTTEPEPGPVIIADLATYRKEAAKASSDDEMAAVIAAAVAAYEEDTGKHFDELMNGITVRKVRRSRR